MDKGMKTCLNNILSAFVKYQNGCSDSDGHELKKQLQLAYGICSQPVIPGSESKHPLFYLSSDGKVNTLLISLSELVSSQHVLPDILCDALHLLDRFCTNEDLLHKLQSPMYFPAFRSRSFLAKCEEVGDNAIRLYIEFMSKVTYGLQHTSSCYDIFGELLSFCIRFIISTAKNITNNESNVTYIFLLANLTNRGNDYLRTMCQKHQHSRKLFDALLELLVNVNSKFVVAALAVLTNIALNMDNETSKKLFKARNLYQTFQVAVNLLMDVGDANLALYGADICLQVLQVQRLRDSLFTYAHINLCIQSFVLLLAKFTSHIHNQKLVEILILLSKNPDGAQIIIHWLFSDNDKFSDKEDIQQSPFQFINSCICQSSVNSSRCLTILRLIFSVLYSASLTSMQVNQVKSLLLNVAKLIVYPNSPLTSAETERLSLALRVIYLACSKTMLLPADFLSSDICISFIEKIWTYSRAKRRDDMNLSLDDTVFECDIVIQCLLLLLLESQWSKHGSKMANDVRILPFIAQGLMSRDNFTTESSLEFLSIVAKQFNFHFKALARYMLESLPSPANYCSELNENSISFLKMDQTLNLDKSVIEEIISRVKSANFSDLKTYEIAMIYEEKIKTMFEELGECEKLLDVKTKDLNQSEKYIMRNKVFITNLECESRKLRCKLLESEQSCDKLAAEIDKASIKLDKQKHINEEQSHNLVRAIAESKAKDTQLAQTVDSLEKLRRNFDKIAKENEFVNAQLHASKNHAAELEHKNMDLNAKLRQKTSRFEESEQQASDLRKQLLSAENRIAELLSDLESHKQINTLIHSMSSNLIVKKDDDHIVKKDTK